MPSTDTIHIHRYVSFIHLCFLMAVSASDHEPLVLFQESSIRIVMVLRLPMPGPGLNAHTLHCSPNTNDDRKAGCCYCEHQPVLRNVGWHAATMANIRCAAALSSIFKSFTTDFQTADSRFRLSPSKTMTRAAFFSLTVLSALLCVAVSQVRARGRVTSGHLVEA